MAGVLGRGLILWGVFRLVRLVRPSDAGVALAIILLLMLPCAGVDVQRGQASVAMAGWVFLGTAEAAGQRWGRATLWLCLALALKPLALVPLLLFAAAFPPLRLPLAAVSRWCSRCRSCIPTRPTWWRKRWRCCER